MNENAKEAILEAARRRAQAHGYGGLNLRDVAAEAGIKAASIYYHFAGKAELGAAVARRYWEVTAATLDELYATLGDEIEALRAYPGLFRIALEQENRMCLCGFMAAEYDDLPGPIRIEVQSFADVNVAWLARMLSATSVPEDQRETRARAIFAAIGGAQLMARSRADVGLFDELIGCYRQSGLIPA